MATSGSRSVKSFRQVAQVFDYAFARLHPRLRGQHDFDPFVFDAGLSHKGKRIENWKQFKKAAVSRDDIHNLVLLFERMAELGIEIDLDCDLFLPEETLAQYSIGRRRPAGADCPIASAISG